MEPTAKLEFSEQQWASRLLWTLVGASLLSWAFELENGAPRYQWAALLAIVAGIWGLATAVVSWLPEQAGGDRRLRELLAWLTALLTVACFGVWVVVQLHNTPSYGTDELAFDQYAGELVRQGWNPYTHTMAPALPLFRVSPGGYTYTLAGHGVTQVSYPALSFLVYVPFLALGWSLDLAPGLEVLGWALAVLLMFKLLPRTLRPAALVLGSVGAYVTLSAIGLTDMVFMPLLVLAAWRWDRFDGRDWRTYLGPIAFGLAMAAKQTPWPILPFILAGLICDDLASVVGARLGGQRARGERANAARASAGRAGRYLAAALVAFLLPNLPFMLASPSAWVHGTLAPLVNSLVPAGQGAIGFSVFLRIGGGSLLAFSLLSVLVLILLLVAYIGTYPLLKPATFLLPAFAYFFAVRSYAIYLVALVPPALIAASTTSLPPLRARRTHGPLRWARSTRWAAAIAGTGLASAALAAYALAAGPPLSLRIIGTPQNAGGSDLAQKVIVQVTNHTDRSVSPAFTMQTASGVTSFWSIWTGPHQLGPDASASYTLLSPNTPSEPSISDGLTILAFLSNPDSVSVSPLYAPPTWHIGFDPHSFDRILPPGTTVKVHLHLLDQWDGPIRKAGVRISVAQTPTGSHAVAALDHGHPGGSTIAFTNTAGVATVTITGVRSSLLPVMISAHPPDTGRPYLAVPSGTLELRFASR